MPQVPSLHEFNVAPSGAPLPGVESTPVQDYGSQQIEQAGRAITRAGDLAGDIYTRELQEMNQLRVDEATNRAKEIQADLTYDPERGFTRVKGRDALEPVDGVTLEDRYAKDYDSALGEIASGLGNDAQRKAFAVSAQGMSTGFRNNIVQHKATEYVNYAKSTISGSLSAGANDIYDNRTDPEKVNNSIGSMQAQLYRLAKLTGMSTGNDLDANVREVVGQALTQAIDRMIDDNDIDGAEAFYALHTDKFTPANRTHIAQVIGQEQDLAVATEEASTGFARYTGAQAEGAAQGLIAPVLGAFKLSSGFGVDRGNHAHGGVDIPQAAGSRVVAAADGKVVFKGQQGNYGNLIKIQHDNGTIETRYAHLKGFADGLEVGSRVRQGQVIAVSGGEKGAPGAGNSSGPHLHYEVRKNGVAVDPMAQHSANGSGRKMSVTEVLQQMRGNPRLTANPRRLQEAERQFKGLVAEFEQEKNQSEQDATDAAMEWLDKNGGRYEQMPASMRNAVPGRARDSLRSFSAALQRPVKAEVPGSVEAWGEARMAIGEGRINSVSQLLRLKPTMDEAHYEDLVGLVSSSKNRPEVLDPVKTASAAMTNLKGALVAAGVDPTPGDTDSGREFSKFQAAFFREVARLEGVQGKPLTETEATEVGNRLIAQSVVKGDGMFGTNTKRRGYEFENPLIPYGAIPPGVRAKMAASLQADGRPVTEEAIRQRYARYLRETGQ